LHNTLANTRNISFEQYITSLNKDDYTIWKATKKFKRLQISITPIRKTDRSWAEYDLEKAENIGEHLSQVFTPHNSMHHYNSGEIEKFLDTPCQTLTAFSPREIRQVIKKVNQHKAPGYDLITGEILKQLPKKAIVLLTTIYNSMLKFSYFSAIWKFAQITMIPKRGKPANEVTSYLPISLYLFPLKYSRNFF
jgi:hypothetical protein